MANIRSSSFVVICVLANILLSVLIILLNKWIYVHYGFPNVTMTCVHFIFTTIGVAICEKLGIFHRRMLPLGQMILLSLTFCGFVVFTNLSLKYNTVGTYQLAKTMTTPTIIVIQTYIYRRCFSVRLRLTLIPIIIGVSLNSYSDLYFNILGAFYAALGVVVTSLYQVLVSEKQQQYHADSLQLLFYQAPLSATLLMPIIPFFEPIFSDHGLLAVWSYEVMIMVCISGVVAFGVNLSIFWIIGHTSALTYNIIGHTKFCLTLVGGLMFFNDHLNWLQVVSIALTASGMALYTAQTQLESVLAYFHVKMTEQNQIALPVKISETEKS